MKTLFTTLLFCLTLALVTRAQNTTAADKDFQAAVTKMLEVSNGLETMAPQIIAMLKQQVPEAPQAFWDDVEKTMADMYSRVIQAMVPVFQKYYTLEDIQDIVRFYESPVGKKLAQSNMKIAMETIPIAQRIGMETMQKLMQTAREKGYVK